MCDFFSCMCLSSGYSCVCVRVCIGLSNNRSHQLRVDLFIEDGRDPQKRAERAYIFVFQNIFVLLEVPSTVWSYGI